MNDIPIKIKIFDDKVNILFREYSITYTGTGHVLPWNMKDEIKEVFLQTVSEKFDLAWVDRK